MDLYVCPLLSVLIFLLRQEKLMFFPLNSQLPLQLCLWGPKIILWNIWLATKQIEETVVVLILNFLSLNSTPSDTKIRNLLHFFPLSSLRRSRYLRSEDRANNPYPSLHYPEIYLLSGGYKQFYAQHPALCQGGYLPMLHPGHKSDFQTFRSKSKTWSCDYKANKSLTKPRKRLGI